MRLAREGWPFVLPGLGAAILLFALGYPIGGAASLALATGVALFFRDPARHFDGPADVLLAAADGKVLSVEEVEADFADGQRRQRIVTFLSVFDVHVQRCPTGGEVVATKLTRGAKVAAFRDDAGEVNERFLTVIRTPAGELVGVVQIAGLVARRVVGYLSEGDRIERGEHLGLIKFGSRVDLYVPPGYNIEVQPGDRVVAGETPMATPQDGHPPDGQPAE